MASDPSAKSVFQRGLLALQSAGVPYMLTGSFATEVYVDTSTLVSILDEGGADDAWKCEIPESLWD